MLQQRQDIKDHNSVGSMIDPTSTTTLVKLPPKLVPDNATALAAAQIQHSVGCSNHSSIVLDDSSQPVTVKTTVSKGKSDIGTIQEDALIIEARNAAIKSVRQSKSKSSLKPSRSPSTTKIDEEPFSFQEATTQAHLTSEPKSRTRPDSSPQAKLKKRPGGRRRRNVTSEELQARKNRSKERNRVAAKRCRQKRKVFMDELRKRTDHLDQLNQRLQVSETRYNCVCVCVCALVARKSDINVNIINDSYFTFP